MLPIRKRPLKKRCIVSAICSLLLVGSSNAQSVETLYKDRDGWGDPSDAASGLVSNETFIIIEGKQWDLGQFHHSGWSLNDDDSNDNNTGISKEVSCCSGTGSDDSGHSDVTLPFSGHLVLYQDLDGDGYGTNAQTALGYYSEQDEGTNVPGGGHHAATSLIGGGWVSNNLDCDDTDPTQPAYWYYDSDADGYGDPDISRLSCSGEGGYVQNRLDCDDQNPAKRNCDELNISDRNYIYAIRPNRSANTIHETTDAKREITYFDGFGRPTQHILHASSVSGGDVISNTTYDHIGRAAKEYLPYKEEGKGSYATAWRSNQRLEYLRIKNDAYAFSETEYEPAPLNRISKTFAPGRAWSKEAGNRPLHYSYQVNEINEVHLLTVDGLLSEGEIFYPKGTLYKQQVTDEAGHLELTFTDKQEQVIAKKSQAGPDHWATTYYLYDDLDRLCVILPPEAVDRMNSKFYKTGSDRIAFLNRWAFQYEYDDQGRMIVKKVPGAAPLSLIYDRWGRLVLTQDGNQHQKAQWTFTTYDALNRPVITGFVTDDRDREAVQAYVSGLTNRYVTYDGSKNYGYNASAYPFSEIGTGRLGDVLTVTYYDDYRFVAKTGLKGTAFQPVYTTGSVHHVVPVLKTFAKGQVTGSMINTGEKDGVASIIYYDENDLPIQTVTQNHLGGTDIVSNQYDFTGKLRKTQTQHLVYGKTMTIKRRMEYDHGDRLINTWHEVNNQGEVLLAHNAYNELGELIEKELHMFDPIGALKGEFSQSLDYTYNMQGWLTSINDSRRSDDSEPNRDLFGMELYYDTNPLEPANTHFNGNIAAMQWSDSQGTGTHDYRSYNFAYDPLNRLTDARHFENGAETSKFGLTGVSYDLNGNIQHLKRKAESTTTLMDNLSYQYDGNRLLGVQDASGDADGFYDGNTSGNDYAYDENGNTISDANKGIDRIKYNHLNLPVEISFSSRSQGEVDKITYRYDAAGIKLSQTLHESGIPIRTTHYIGELHYEDLHEGDGPRLQLIQHEEGRIVPKYGSGGHAQPIETFDYQYHLTDHLGNVRVTYSTMPEKYEMVEDFEDDQSDFTDLKRHNRRTANRTTGGSYVSAVARQETSAMTLLRLNKGDVVNLSVYASYETNADEHAFLPMAYHALFSSFDEAFGDIEGISCSVNEFNEALNSANMMGKSNAQPLAPRAYLNYLFFDKEMHYVTAGYQQISKTAGETDAFERVELDRPFVANQEGYILAYLSNEDQGQGHVYFDDFTVYHEKTMVVSSQDYYPFGSQFNSHTRTASVPNKYKYQGMELQPETETYLADFRSYDPAIGRWQQVDPKANEFHSPYAGMGNNPIMYYDFLGDTIVDANGAVAKLVNNVNEQIDALNSVLNNKDFNYDKLGFSKKQVQSKVKALKGVLSEINRMKVSAQVYHVQNADDQGAGVSFDAKTGAIDIRVNASSSIGLIGHELLHGFQFENGDLSLFKDNSAYGSLYDIGDETAGYNRERLLDGGIGSTVAEKRTDSWTRQTGAKMTPQAYQKLPNGPININSPQGKAIQKKLRQGTSKEVVIGWKNYDRSK